MRAILLSGVIALLLSLLGTRLAIRQFTKWGYGQEIRDDGPTSHHTKRGTPTMGGVVIILAGVLMHMDIYFRQTSLFNTLVMLGLLFGGVGLVARSLRAS